MVVEVDNWPSRGRLWVLRLKSRLSLSVEVDASLKMSHAHGK